MFTFGLNKSKAVSEVASKIERTCQISQFDRRGYFRSVVDPAALQEIKKQFTLEDSDDPAVQSKLTQPTFGMKRVTRIIDVSDGIKKEDQDLFQANQRILSKQHRHSYST